MKQRISRYTAAIFSDLRGIHLGGRTDSAKIVSCLCRTFVKPENDILRVAGSNKSGKNMRCMRIGFATNRKLPWGSSNNRKR